MRKKNIMNTIIYTDNNNCENTYFYMSYTKIGIVYAQRIIKELGIVSRVDSVLIEK